MKESEEFQKGYQAYLDRQDFSAFEDMDWIDGYLQALYDKTDEFINEMDEDF